MSYEVWAPHPTRVELFVAGRRVPMRRCDDDWWEPTEEVAWRPGVEYGYLLDGEEHPVPDPRSRRQPHGVHGLSSAVDLAAHAWADGAWAGRELRGGVIYELHVGTFTPGGTLDSAIDRLDYLAELGVTFVELLPVAAVNGTHNWGYDGVLWFAVHEPYGGPAAYQRFVDACHARGLAVIQDVVYNHLGPSGNYLPQFGPYLGTAATTWGEAVNLAEPEVRRYILDNATMWFRDFHVDGLRLDAVHALADDRVPHLLAELATTTDALSLELARPLTLIAESDLNDPVMITPRGLGGYGLAAQWDDDYHHAAHVALTGETFGYYADFDSLSAFAKVLTGGFFHDGTYSSFRGRAHGHPLDTRSVPAWRLVTFTQDHDQVGNRAAGDRPSQSADASTLAIEAVLAVLTPFTPMLFMGQEWGATTPWQFFTSHPEPELGRATAEGRLAEFERMGWDPDLVPDPQDPATFERSKLDWEEASEEPHARLAGLYWRLISLRQSRSEFTDGQFVTDVVFDEAERWIRYSLGAVTVALNFSETTRTLPCVARSVLLETGGDVLVGQETIALPPRCAVVVEA